MFHSGCVPGHPGYSVVAVHGRPGNLQLVRLLIKY